MPHRGWCSATMVRMNDNTQFPIRKAAAPNATAQPKPETQLIRPPPLPLPFAVILRVTPHCCHPAGRPPPSPSCRARAPPCHSEEHALSPPCHSEGCAPQNLRCLLTRRLIVVTGWPSKGDFRFLTAVRNDRGAFGMTGGCFGMTVGGTRNDSEERPFPVILRSATSLSF